jgi:molecular chaperone GrpE
MNEHAAEGREEQAVEQDIAPDQTSESEATAGDHSANAAEVQSLREELEKAKEQTLRLAAELDNVRKRSEREVENAHRYGMERFAQALLPVIDSFEAGLNAENLQLDSLLEGQRATLRLLEQAFESAGITPIDPNGEPFDPEKHEAMSMLASPTAEPDSVIDVIQKGYALHARLLRPARVIVAKAP